MAESKPRTAVYTGSFDPVTLGHLNIIERASSLVDRLIVGIGINVEKQATRQLANVEVQSFRGLAVHFVRNCGARVMLRGVRSLSDIESEFTMTLANRQLDAGIETVFLMADEQYTHVSSSLLKQITPLASDEELARFVPQQIICELRKKFPADG